MGIIDEKIEALRERLGDDVIDRFNNLRTASPPMWTTEECSVPPGLDYRTLAEIVFTAVFLARPLDMERSVSNGRHVAKLLFEAKDE